MQRELFIILFLATSFFVISTCLTYARFMNLGPGVNTGKQSLRANCQLSITTALKGRGRQAS